MKKKVDGCWNQKQKKSQETINKKHFSKTATYLPLLINTMLCVSSKKSIEPILKVTDYPFKRKNSRGIKPLLSFYKSFISFLVHTGIDIFNEIHKCFLVLNQLLALWTCSFEW